MARLVLNPDLEAIAAARAARKVDRVAEQLAGELRRRVPAAKVWVSEEDGRVRPSHVDAHGQTIPNNVPYKVKRMVYVRKGRTRPGQRGINIGGGWRMLETIELATRPRDRRLSPENRMNCRCWSDPVPGVTARAVRTSKARVQGTQVRARVTIRFPRIVESEFAEQGGGWARAALRATAARSGRG